MVPNKVHISFHILKRNKYLSDYQIKYYVLTLLPVLFCNTAKKAKKKSVLRVFLS